MCDWRELFIDVEGKLLESVHDGRVFATSGINRVVKEERIPMLFKDLFSGYDKVPVILLGDPASPLLPYRIKQ